MAEAAILRVVHCGSAIFCRRAPPRCPACSRPLPSGLQGAPLRVPSPFRHGHRQQRSFLLRAAAPRDGFRYRAGHGEPALRGAGRGERRVRKGRPESSSSA
uniref:MKRN2 opposite strand protein-like N-terminal domain-containing protein n=1 Tax=Melopsittacus undulatus TaxID=13146 RepID=A0A8V5G7K5_MELUD